MVSSIHVKHAHVTMMLLLLPQCVCEDIVICEDKCSVALYGKAYLHCSFDEVVDCSWERDGRSYFDSSIMHYYCNGGINTTNCSISMEFNAKLSYACYQCASGENEKSHPKVGRNVCIEELPGIVYKTLKTFIAESI